TGVRILSSQVARDKGSSSEKSSVVSGFEGSVLSLPSQTFSPLTPSDAEPWPTLPALRGEGEERAKALISRSAVWTVCSRSPRPFPEGEGEPLASSLATGTVS